MNLFAEAVSAILATAQAVVVDLAAVELVDAAAIRGLNQARQSCLDGQIWFAAVESGHRTRPAVEVLGQDKALSEYDTLAEAMRAASLAVTGLNLMQSVELVLARVAGLPPEHRLRMLAEPKATELAMPLAGTLAARYHNRGEPFEDLVQVASIGLIQAVHGFNPLRARPFLAFAVPTILGELRHHLRDHSWPFGCHDACRSCGSSFPGRPTNRNRLGGEPDPDIVRIDNRLSLARLLPALPLRHRRLLDLRFNQGLTQSQIGAPLGISRMPVSRNLASLLARLRKSMEALD